MALAHDDLAVFAATVSGLSLVAGENLFAGPLPAVNPAEDAEPMVALVPYGAGRPSEPAFGVAGPKWEWPRVQVLVRGARDGLAAAEALAQALYEAFGAIETQTVNGAAYLTVTCLQPPAFLRWDDDHRPEVVFNVECYREVPS